MTTPADELRTAAGRLRELATADGIEPGPWRTEWHEQQYELRSADPTTYPIAEWTFAIATQEPKASEQRAECDTANADYIAAMHPGVGLALAAWLGSWDGVEFDEHASMPDDLRHALIIARAINGSST